jgi:hypothetical protein
LSQGDAAPSPGQWKRATETWRSGIAELSGLGQKLGRVAPERFDDRKQQGPRRGRERPDIRPRIGGHKWIVVGGARAIACEASRRAGASQILSEQIGASNPIGRVTVLTGGCRAARPERRDRDDSLIKTDSLYNLCYPAQVAPAAVCQNGVMNYVVHPVEPLAIRLTLTATL